jgi:hypothetical protein
MTKRAAAAACVILALSAASVYAARIWNALPTVIDSKTSIGGGGGTSSVPSGTTRTLEDGTTLTTEGGTTRTTD